MGISGTTDMLLFVAEQGHKAEIQAMYQVKNWKLPVLYQELELEYKPRHTVDLPSLFHLCTLVSIQLLIQLLIHSRSGHSSVLLSTWWKWCVPQTVHLQQFMLGS